MQKATLLDMIRQNRVAGIGQPEEVDALAKQYPYVASFQILKAIALKESGDIAYHEQLSRTAIAVQDRTKLYEYMVKQSLVDRIDEDSQEANAPDPNRIEAPFPEREESPQDSSAPTSFRKNSFSPSIR